MTKPTAWKCEVCGYIHFGDAPPDQCPVCGVGPELFSPFEAAVFTPPPGAASWRCTVCNYIHRGETPPDRCPVCGAARSMFESFQATETHAVTSDIGRIVILGAGIAGLTAAEQARAFSPSLSITLVSSEPGLPYYRINLTRYLAGQIGDEALTLKPPSWFTEQRVELVHGEAVAIDRERRQIALRDGRSLSYDRLIIATGAHPFVPPIPGATLRGVFTFRTKDDAQTIWKAVPAGSRCVCIGGGLLGLETAGALARRGTRVTVLEGFDWLLPRQLAEPAGKLLREHMERSGLEVHCGARIEEILSTGRALQVRLERGGPIEAEAVIVAAGVRPNSYLARQSHLDVKAGIIVDDRMFTSDPTILAAGDAAEHRGVVYGLWPASYAEGLVAGGNAAGGSMEFRGLSPSSRLKVMDIDLFSIGQHQPPDASYQVVECRDRGIYSRYVCRDGKLVGANLYGDTSLAGLVKEAIERGAQVADSAALLAKVPELAEHCRKAHSTKP